LKADPDACLSNTVGTVMLILVRVTPLAGLPFDLVVSAFFGFGVAMARLKAI